MADHFDWTEYLRLAHQLAGHATDEAAQRTAISRVYYCVYHRATEVVRGTTDLRLLGHRIWDQLEAYAKANDRPDLRRIGERGNDLRRRRIIADYRNPYNRDNHTLPPLTQLAADAISHADYLLQLLD